MVFKTPLVFLCFAAVAVLTFSNALRNPFLMDDHAYFFSDMRAQTPRMLANFFIPDMRKNLGMDKTSRSATYYRPLAYFVPNVCYMAFKTNTLYYHIFNLLLFTILCFTIYKFIFLFTGDVVIAFLVGLFFCTHPVNGLMVNYITAHIFAIQLIFMLLSAICFLKKNNVAGPLFFVGALLCHETAMALPFYLVILFLLKRREEGRRWVALMPYFVILFCFALFRLFFASLKTSIMDKYHFFSVTIFQYIASFLNLVGWYVGKLFYPKGIVLIWATPAVATDIIAYILLFGFILAGAYLTYKYYHRTDQHALGGLLWFLIGFIPVCFACLLNPKWGFMFEPHWMYFASIGFFLWLACVWKKVFHQYALAAALFLIVPWVVISHYYNVLWSSEKGYCQYWLKESHGLPGAVLYLADVYLREENYPNARKLYEEHGLDWGVLNNLGLLAMGQGRVDEARENFMQALKHDPHAGPVFANLASLELSAGHMEAAQKYAEQSIEYNNFLIQPRRLLVRIYITQGKIPKALALAKDTFAAFPRDDKNLYYLVLLEWGTHLTQKGHEHARRLLAQCQDPGILNDLVLLARQFGFMEFTQGVKI